MSARSDERHLPSSGESSSPTGRWDQKSLLLVASSRRREGRRRSVRSMTLLRSLPAPPARWSYPSLPELPQDSHAADFGGARPRGALGFPTLLRRLQLDPGVLELFRDPQMIELDHPRDRMGESVDREHVALFPERDRELLGESVTELLLAHSQRDLCGSGHR